MFSEVSKTVQPRILLQIYENHLCQCDLARELLEGLADVLPGARARLEELHPKLFRQRAPARLARRWWKRSVNYGLVTLTILLDINRNILPRKDRITWTSNLIRTCFRQYCTSLAAVGNRTRKINSKSDSLERIARNRSVASL